MKLLSKEEITAKPEAPLRVKCKLISVTCYRASERGGDEIYLKIENKKIWPARPFAKIKPSEEIMIDVDVFSDERGFLRVDLWEKDFFSDDLLGFFQFVSVGSNGKFSTDLTPCNKDVPPRYILNWEK
ncbi:MAG TPA: hypothetical protein VL728_04105 [Cyclobacteriaceae bacterium]|jgi:hypothetical protein|nr:hypothetical protein [Cyclobacteriaceae bacterium]